jgi:hypothetical protein
MGALSVVRCALAVLLTVPTAAPAYQGVPALPRNACGSSSLPQSYGTNFPVPPDPYGHGFADQSALGWDGNYYPVFAYLSGAFFARGVNNRYTAGSTTYCGAMYSFGVYQYGLGTATPPAGSVQWTMDAGHLPALTTSFSRGTVSVTIRDFADKVTIGSSAFSVMYARVSVTNHGTAAVTVDPAPSGPNLAALTNPGNSVPAGGTVSHDYAVAVDNFGSGAALPTGTALTSAIPSLDTASAQMTSYWNGRLAAIPSLTLPNTSLPNTNGLANPGTVLVDAYQAAFVYSHVVQAGEAQFSGANNYAWMLNHDVPQILANRFALGDLTDAPNLLLTARASEATNFDEKGANWYWDGVWKTPWAWAAYLARSGDTAFVSQYFHDDASGTTGPFGPSLYTLVHELPGQLNPSGYLKTSFDNDSSGTWLFDDFAAVMGLAAYKYLATGIGNTAEAAWADTQMRSLANATATALAANESANHFAFLPCEVDKPMSANRCNTASDANWASANYIGQDAWDTYLMGGPLPGVLGDPAQTDGLYAMGFARLSGSLPFPTMGGYSGYSTANNTGYAEGALYGTAYRSLPITSYAWQLATTTGGPNAWWEANGSGPSSANPWAGSHAPPQFGACPYAWPMAGQTLGLLDSIAAEGLAATGSGGSFAFTRPLYVGRGIPDTWIAAGQTIAASNLTTTASATTRSTYGVSLAVTKPAAQRVVTVTLSGSLPGGAVLVQLPAFASIGVASVTGGTYSATTHTVTVTPGTTTVTITLTS